MNIILKTKTKAISYAKKFLRDKLGVHRISCVVTTSSCQCDCGETKAVTVSNNGYHSYFIIVGICNTCGS